MKEIDTKALWEKVKEETPEANETMKIAEELSEIIDSISSIRIEKGITQRELASMCGITQSTIARIETLQVIPRLETLIKIAYKLNLKVSISHDSVMLDEIKLTDKPDYFNVTYESICYSYRSHGLTAC